MIRHLPKKTPKITEIESCKQNHDFMRTYEIESCNKACQSLCMSDKETPLEKPLAEHQWKAKKLTLS